ncbi:CHC2 zinc finger domain-containing protein [Microbulbifer epialgicus]|uniref:CHC2 zinc finger domain-containing protein n=1 Tax=Microbulbifer epialgicus TaxID=393907 RepID=A0ABV4P5V4_9GAMM
MARIADQEIERIKSEISLLRLVESQGYQPERQGKDYVVSCPFHEEKTPSLIISPKSNLFNCFGCGAAGSVIDWVMKTRGVSFRFACELLQKDLGLITETGTRTVKQNTTIKLDMPLNADADHQMALAQVMEYYHQTLKQSPEALAYLENRGLGDRELIEHFKLGFANRTLGYRLPEKAYKAGKEIRGKLQAVGLLRASGHEHFNGSLVVPIFNRDGDLVEIYGRKIRDDLRKGTPKHLYLPGPHAGVWNSEGLEGQREVILCEALIDAMTFWVNGYRNVTASYGTSGFTDDHLQCFKHCGVERVLIAYDRDEAGNKAAEQLAKRLSEAGIDGFRIELPKGMDVNEYALQVTPPEKSLGLAIRKAVWLGNGKAPERQLEIESQTGQPVTLEAESLTTENEDSINPALAAQSTAPQASALPALTPAPPAEAVPESPQNDIAAEVTEQEITLSFGNPKVNPRRYRIRGLEKNKSYEVLKVNLLASCDDGLHVDTFDLYNAKHRQQFIKLAALELAQEENTIKKDLGKVLLKLEQLQEQQLDGDKAEAEQPNRLSDQEQQQALELLRDPDLLQRILSDFERCGVVGEETNKLVGYLAAGSRKLTRPLAVMIQSTSAAGKSSLMEAVLNLVPEEERVQYSAMTGQSLFYMGETNLKHKILAIAEEEGASQASYALKLLQSEGQITIASTGKDDSSGNLVTREYKVEGPVMLFLTTTAIDIDEELLNRCVVLTVNESRAQTQLIHAAQRQRRTLAGLTASLEKEHLVKLHRNVQRLLKPLAVINPYADQLTFLDDKTRTRRDHEKYLTLIDSIALLHQYQREVKTVNSNGKTIEYLEVQLSDIEIANRLAHEILGRTLDELPPQTRKLLKLIQQMVTKACKQQSLEQKDYRFSRRDIREFTGWSDNQLKVHCLRLTELEYLLIHRGGRGQSISYELLYDNIDERGAAHLMGLIDSETLQNPRYDQQKLGAEKPKLAPSCPQVGAKLDSQKTPQPIADKALRRSGPKNSKSTSCPEKKYS